MTRFEFIMAEVDRLKIVLPKKPAPEVIECPIFDLDESAEGRKRKYLGMKRFGRNFSEDVIRDQLRGGGRRDNER